MGSEATVAAVDPPVPRTNRKTYTVSKAREKWTDEEHAAFVEALKRRGRNWKAIVQDIGTRTVAQVRSHAQKYFLRLEKEGRAKEIPQPRPKKRASHPYPVQARSAYAYAAQPPAKARKIQKGQTASGTESADQAAGAHSTSSVDQAATSATVGALSAAASQAEADANFSKLYAIVGSMFDSTVSLPEQLSTIEHLPAEQREPLLLMLGHLTANLRETVRNQQPAATALQLPQPLQWGLQLPDQQAGVELESRPRSQRSRARK